MFENTVRQKLRCALIQGDEHNFVQWCGDISCVVQYIKFALNSAFAETGIPVDAKALPYSPGSKIPIAITLASQEPRLLWYCKGMSASEVSDELLELFADMISPNEG